MNTSPKDSEPTLREHPYDGIQEYDQKLPNWWLFTLYIMIVAWIIYWLAYYQLGIGKTDTERVDAAMATINAAREQNASGLDDAKLWAMSRDPAIVAAGEKTFMTPGLCVTCHGPDLSGTMTDPTSKAVVKLPGQPLNDTAWKYGGKPTQILNIARKGSPDVTKGMPAWEPALGLQKVSEAIAFILSKHKEGEPITLTPDSPLAK
jgi:cytochrome c oxidase cbb3-type subunit 3